MAEQHLDDADVDAVLEQVGREAVAQRVRPDPLGDIRRSCPLDDDAMQLPLAEEREAEALPAEPAPKRPEPVSSELDPTPPKRSGWRQRAKASFGG